MAREDLEYKVIIDHTVNNRMYEHVEFLAQVNEKAATQLLDTLLKDIRSLESMPYRNPVYNRPYIPSGKYRYLISNDRYHIIYQIEKNKVYVDYIQDCRQSDSKSLI